MTHLRLSAPYPPGVDHDFDAHLFDPAREDDAVTCPACAGRCRVQGEDCPLCDGDGRVVL